MRRVLDDEVEVEVEVEFFRKASRLSINQKHLSRSLFLEFLFLSACVKLVVESLSFVLRSQKIKKGAIRQR